MRANLGRNWRLTDLAAIAGDFRPDLAASVPQLRRQDSARRASRDRARMRPPRTAAGDAGDADHGRRAATAAFRISGGSRSRIAVATARRRRRRWRGRRRLRTRSAAMPALLMPARDRPVMAFGPVEASPENREMAADLADQLVAALTRAGISVVTGTRAARHLLTAAIRGTGVHTQLIVRLIDTETGRQLWAHRADGLSARRNRQQRASCHQDRRGAAAVPAAGRDRSRAAKARGVPRRLRPGAARHARRSLARRQRQCAARWNCSIARCR